MALLISILLWIGGILLAMMLAFISFFLYARKQLHKIRFGLPWLTWLTIEEACAKGFSKWWMEFWLPTLYKHHQLEIRAKPGVEIPAYECDFISKIGYPSSMRFYEFRFTMPGRRRKREKLKVSFSDVVGGLLPSPA